MQRKNEAKWEFSKDEKLTEKSVVEEIKYCGIHYYIMYPAVESVKNAFAISFHRVSEGNTISLGSLSIGFFGGQYIIEEEIQLAAIKQAKQSVKKLFDVSFEHLYLDCK